MSASLLAVFALLWLTLLWALLAKTRALRGTCARCGLPFERRVVDERVCRCDGRNR